MSEQLAERVALLESEVAQLKTAVENASHTKMTALSESSARLPWWEKRAGRFANEPMYDEAMQLGRKYRESFRPQSEI